MKQWDFIITGKYNSCMYHHPSTQILCLVHGDDVASVGDAEKPRWLKEKFTGRFEIKTTTVGRKTEEGEVKEARILNSVIRVTPGGLEYDANQRQADFIIKEIGAAGMSSPTQPGGDKKVMEEEEKPEELAGAEATGFGAVPARANYFAADRPAIQYAVKQICRTMAKPVNGDWHKLVRLGRCLDGSPRCVLEHRWQEKCSAPLGFSDSDWAGCRTSGKSTNGGVVMVGRRLFKSWNRTQDAVTLSSAEAELLALGKLAMDMLDIRSMTQEWSIIEERKESQLFADASGALNIAKR